MQQQIAEHVRRGMDICNVARHTPDAVEDVLALVRLLKGDAGDRMLDRCRNLRYEKSQLAHLIRPDVDTRRLIVWVSRVDRLLQDLRLRQA